MKNVLKIMVLLFSFSLAAENTIESAAIASIANKTSVNISQENGNQNKDESKIKKIINYLDDPVNIFVTGATTIGTLQVLDYIAVLAHEYGHAIPYIMTGNDYTITTSFSGDVIYPFNGCCRTIAPATLLTTILGPIAGVSTTYLQCATIKALYDSHIQNKSFAETFKQALKYPITFFNNTMNASEKALSSYLDKKPLPPSDQEEATPSAFAVNTMILFRTIRMIGESIYGFLPYDTGIESKGDGERMWHMLLGKQPPTFKAHLGLAATGIMATPVAIGAMKAMYKKVNEKSDQSDSENVTQPA